MARVAKTPAPRKNLPPATVETVTPRAIRGAVAELLALQNLDERFAALLLRESEAL